MPAVEAPASIDFDVVAEEEEEVVVDKEVAADDAAVDEVGAVA